MKIKELFGNSKIVGLVGEKNCLPKNTLVQTPNGLKKIQNVKKVYSYNFKKNKIEIKKAKRFNTGNKNIFIIKTKIGKIRCSPEHKWFIKRNGKITICPTKHLKSTDVLLRYEK